MLAFYVAYPSIPIFQSCIFFCLESSPNIVEPQINPNLNPSSSCIPSTFVTPSYDRFYFQNSLREDKGWCEVRKDKKEIGWGMKGTYMTSEKGGWYINLEKIYVCACIGRTDIIINFNIYFPASLFYGPCYPTLIIYPLKMKWNIWKHTSHLPLFVQHLRGNSKCASTKRGTILEGNAARMKIRNFYRQTGSVYFYLINVNSLSH